MKTTLLFLLFAAFCTQHLTLAAESVLDFYDNPVEPDKLYHILQFNDTGRGIQLEEIGSQTCPVTVVMGIDPKWVGFQPLDIERIGGYIDIDEPLSIGFAVVSECATSKKWAVEIAGNSQYPVLVGPPRNTTSMPGTFNIKKAKDNSNAYNIAFKFHEKDEHLLYTKKYNTYEDRVLVNLCADKGIDVVFYPYSKPESPSPTPAPTPPPTPSTFEPLIRKRVA